MKTSDNHSAIHARLKTIESAFTSGDASELAEFYTVNGMLLPPGFGLVQGKENIAAFWQIAMDMGIKSITFDTIEIEQHDDTAIEISEFTMGDADNQAIDRGKGIAIWKYEDNVWKVHRDIWNSSEDQQ